MNTVTYFSLVFTLLFANAQGQGRGAIRLYNNGQTSTTLQSGIAQIYYNNEWSTICNLDSNGVDVADTICRQLGYVSGSVSNSQYGKDESVTAAISEVVCDFNTLNVLQCDFSTSVLGCTSNDDLAVECVDKSLAEFPGGVRLTGNTDYSGTGRVEVYCNGNWGLVCNSGFSSEDANTVCRELGYTNATNHGGTYGNGDSTQSVWLDTPSCGQNTNCLSNCKNCPTTESTSCTVNNVVGVTCSYESNSYYSGKNAYCLFADSSTLNIVGIVIGCIVALLVCAVLAVAIPLLICCCLGVGIGAAAGKRASYSNI